MRVAHVTAPAGFGGLESIVLGLTSGLRRDGIDTSLWLVTDPSTPPPELARAAAAADVDVRTVVVPGRSYLSEKRAVRQLCREHAIDVLHTHGYRPDIIDGPVGRRLGIPVVTTVHGFTGGDLKNRLYEWLQVRAFRRMDAVVAVSARLEAELRRAGVPPGRLHLIRNAWVPPGEMLDRRESLDVLGLGCDKRVVGWVGRASQEKGLDVALEAMTLLDLPDVVLAVVGDGPDVADLSERYRHLESAGRLVWCGAHERAHRLYPAFDVFLLSSHTEGTPVVIFEAMAAGVPIVATAVGGVPDVVTETEAILVEPANAGAMAGALSEVLTEPHRTAGRIAAAESRLLQFDSGKWIAAYTNLYRKLL